MGSSGQLAGGGAIYGLNPIPPGGYTRHIDAIIGGAIVGVTAPVDVTIGTMRGLAFDADAEVVHFYFHIPSDWDGVSNFTLRIHWVPESGDALANGETVKWDVTYRSVAIGDAIDAGTAVVATTTHTQSGSGTDKEHIVTEITLNPTNVNQPIVVQDCLVIQFDRDVGVDTYAGDGIVFHWELSYTANALPVH